MCIIYSISMKLIDIFIFRMIQREVIHGCLLKSINHKLTII